MRWEYRELEKKNDALLAEIRKAHAKEDDLADTIASLGNELSAIGYANAQLRMSLGDVKDVVRRGLSGHQHSIRALFEKRPPLVASPAHWMQRTLSEIAQAIAWCQTSIQIARELSTISAESRRLIEEEFARSHTNYLNISGSDTKTDVSLCSRMLTAAHTSPFSQFIERPVFSLEDLESTMLWLQQVQELSSQLIVDLQAIDRGTT